MKQIIIGLNIAIFIFASCRCNGWLESWSPIYVDNKSEYIILTYTPLIGKEEDIYPDTSFLFVPKNKIGYITKPGEKSRPTIPHISIKQWVSSFPQDTVSIFIFSKDTLDKFSWFEIQSGYKILQRYDLSLEDFNSLSNKNGVPVIDYPPSEAMKYMKMYPPYGQ